MLLLRSPRSFPIQATTGSTSVPALGKQGSQAVLVTGSSTGIGRATAELLANKVAMGYSIDGIAACSSSRPGVCRHALPVGTWNLTESGTVINTVIDMHVRPKIRVFGFRPGACHGTHSWHATHRSNTSIHLSNCHNELTLRMPAWPLLKMP